MQLAKSVSNYRSLIGRQNAISNKKTSGSLSIMAHRVRVLIIHLGSASARLPQVRKLEAGIKLPSIIIAAFAADEAKGTRYVPDLHRPRYPFALRSEELACFESHRRAWQHIVDNDLDFGLVVEDDADIIDPKFTAGLELALENATVHDFVRFPIKQRECPRITIASVQATELYQPDYIGLGCVCQLVGRRAAELLLAATKEFDRPVDSFIQLYWLTGVYPLCVVPSGVREISDELGGSLIHRYKNISAWWVPARAAKRFLYRACLRLLSRLHSSKAALNRLH